MPTIDQSLCISCGLCARSCSTGVLTYEDGAPVVHPERRCMGCWHCAAICPTQAIREEGLDLYPAPPDSSLEKLVAARRSCRHFQPEPPEREVIARALSWAAWAPSGKNERTYGWTVLYGKERVEGLLALLLEWAAQTPEFQVLTKLVRKGRDPITCGAPCVLFCHNVDPVSNPQTDAVIAATTAELLLFEQGVGTCWGGYLRRAVNACPAAREYLNIPAERTVHAVLLTGRPEREPYQRPPYRPAPAVDWR